MIRMENREKNKLESVFDDPFLLAGEIENTADVLLTLGEFIDDILWASPEKLELLGSYADTYKRDVGRVENALYAMNTLIDKVRERSSKISYALIEESRKERSV